MKEHTGSFLAYHKDGRCVNLNIYTDMINAGTFDNPKAVIPGLKEIKTDDGLSVNRLDKGKYQIVITGEVLTSDDPNAP